MKHFILISFLLLSSTFINETYSMKQTTEIYLAGGCFWGTEHFIRQVKGVKSTEVGYANSLVPHPSYEAVCSGKTNAAETVKVVYDSSEADLNFLLELFFQTIDPTSHNRQGNDMGTQYRTGIYYTRDSDLPIIRRAIANLATKYSLPLAIEVKPLENFYPAEAYHQDYLVKHPTGYCHIPSKLFDIAKEAKPTSKVFKRADEATLRKELTPIQYNVTQKNATEPAFNNQYWNEHRAGIYVDITTGEPLFISTDKFDSGCGWPSFSKPISDGLIVRKEDASHGMIRTEVRSKTGDAHLGHVFDDGPTEKGGLRYCINSASLRFIPKEEMEKAGYTQYLHLVK